MGGALCIFASLLGIRAVYFKIDAFGDSLNFAYHYNHLFCLASSVALFYTFKHWKLKDGVAARFIGRVAPYTFGAYLLHEHILVRTAWTGWLGTAPTDNLAIFILHLLWKPLLVLAVGILLDWLRALVFKGVGRAVTGGWFDTK